MNKAERYGQVNRLIGNLYYQLQSGVHTYSKCYTCDGHARGGGHCPLCIRAQFLELGIPPMDIDELIHAIKSANRICESIRYPEE